MSRRAEEIRNRRIHEAHIAWAGMLLYIIAYDVWAMKGSKITLSQAVANGMTRGWGRVWLIAIWIIVSKHLFLSDFLPRLDPIGAAAHKFRKRAGTL